MSDRKYEASMFLGSVQLHTWIEPNVMPDGQFALIGRGLSIRMDMDGRPVEVMELNNGVIGWLSSTP